MSNKTLSQFTEQTEADINDFAVGYGPNPQGQLTEKRYSLPTLGSQILPYNGLTTGTFQIRKLAQTQFDISSSAAITSQEEVISWGSNPNRSKWGSTLFSIQSARQSASKPINISFFSGTPLSPGESFTLKSRGLKIQTLLDNYQQTLVLLDDGTVWFKGWFGGTTAPTGTDPKLPQGFGDLNVTSRGTSGFFQIPSAFFVSDTGATIGVKSIGVLPELPDNDGNALWISPASFSFKRAVYWAIDMNDDLHVWGSFGSTAGTLPGGVSSEVFVPTNITKNFTSGSLTLNRNVKQSMIIGAGKLHTIVVLTKDGKIFTAGHNATGIAANGNTTNTTTWTAATRIADLSNVGGATIPVTDADQLVETNYNYSNLAYISTPVNNRTYLFVSGSDATGYLRPTTPGVASSNKCFAVLHSSDLGDSHVKAGMFATTKRSSLLTLTTKGSVYGFGSNAVGEVGVSPAGFVSVQNSKVQARVKDLGWTQGGIGGLPFGGAGSGLVATNIFLDRTSFSRPAAVITATRSGKHYTFIAGFRTLANINQGDSTLLDIDPNFRLLPFNDEIQQVTFATTDSANHSSTLFVSANNRVYGLGRSIGGFITESDSGSTALDNWVLAPQIIF